MQITLEQLARDVGFAPDAIRFLLDAAAYAPQYLGQEPGDVQDAPQIESPLQAPQLCQVVLEFAEDCFEDEAPAMLWSWGLRSSADLGRLVQRLAQQGVQGVEMLPMGGYDGHFALPAPPTPADGIYEG